MFTGIIQAVGNITHLEARGGDVRLRIRTGKLDLADVRLGDSIAVNGVCLTAVDLPGDGFAADVSRETLSLTTLGDLVPGSPVNLEKALTLATRLGGHLVSGHVDAVGRIQGKREEGTGWRLIFDAPEQVLRYVIKKGSIAIDGVSLTVADVDRSGFSVAMIPHTAKLTTLGHKSAGDSVNLEADLIGKYVERLLEGRTGGGVSIDLLKQQGFA